MAAYKFQNLRVYQMALDYIDAIYELSRQNILEFILPVPGDCALRPFGKVAATAAKPAFAVVAANSFAGNL